MIKFFVRGIRRAVPHKKIAIIDSIHKLSRKADSVIFSFDTVTS